MFVGYLYGIRSKRQLEREVQMNIAYRWFLGLNFDDSVPDHTTISWNRRTLFKDTNIFQDIFDEIVVLAMNHRMVSGRALMTDLKFNIITDVHVTPGNVHNLILMSLVWIDKWNDSTSKSKRSH